MASLPFSFGVAPQPAGLERLRRNQTNTPYNRCNPHALDPGALWLDQRRERATNAAPCSTNDCLHPRRLHDMIRRMLLLLAFLLGIANFAAHRAVAESGHPVLSVYARESWPVVRFAMLLIEFAVLTGVMLVTWAGQGGWLWFYVFYSIANIGFAWAITTRRI